MELRAERAICAPEDGFVQIGWEFPDSEADYVLITIPESDAPAVDDFFGHSHYVEVRDQLYGQYGGLAELAVLDEHRVLLRLNYEIPDLDSELAIAMDVAMSPEILAQFRRAEALVRRARSV